ncbi:unnamed protein product [Hermetia illucens]|uniref:Uncharacterized protein n=1 Tax=Hermetia illucens TaxID=343691 RepID=A0A7R8UT58_HERIL|nr:unnamed protein product [Hermetia illucens]
MKQPNNCLPTDSIQQPMTCPTSATCFVRNHRERRRSLFGATIPQVRDSVDSVSSEKLGGEVTSRCREVFLVDQQSVQIVQTLPIRNTIRTGLQIFTYLDIEDNFLDILDIYCLAGAACIIISHRRSRHSFSSEQNLCGMA